MQSLKNMLSKIITSRPDVIQFAKDRKYEESWIIPLLSTKPIDEVINNYLSKEKFETLIVEYIWNSDDNDNRFVLTLFLDKNCHLQDPKNFINISLDLFYNYKDFDTFTKIIDTQIIGKEYLFMNLADSIDLGVFNHWLSVGPIELWKEGDVYNMQTVVKKIQSRPEIEKTNLNYQGLLFRFNVDGQDNGPYYGIKTPCCDKQKDLWVINYKKIDYWIKLMLQIK